MAPLSGEHVRVVGVALLSTGADGRRRLLAARRSAPPELAGRWELPGGKCRPGEPLAEAAVREVAEELGCRVRVTGELAGTQPVRPGVELHAVTAELVAGVPTPTEHDALRWLEPPEFGQVDWLAPDVPFLDELRERWSDLGGGAGMNDPAPARAVFFDEDVALTVASRLASDGFTAAVVRERLAGEDDDEDHPWAVLSDAPEVVLELLVERYDGWLDVPEPRAPAAPLDLPRAPRRRSGEE